MTEDLLAHRALGLRPGPALGVAAWLAYTAVTIGVQASSGIPYAEWFKTAGNAWRTGVLSLACGSVLLVVIVALTRWPTLWRDPQRLPTTRLLRWTLVLWWGVIAMRLAGVAWERVPMDLLAAILASGILVGFAEEVLFRGIFLRCLREGGRPEASAAIWTAVCFGLFHLPNVFMGTGAAGLLQVLLAALSGALLYGFRRHYAALWPAMVAHGAWDISTFLAGGFARPWLNVPTLASVIVFALLGLAVLASIWRNDRQLVVLPA
jgi:membrane protease YdiL (CAAX protease family)